MKYGWVIQLSALKKIMSNKVFLGLSDIASFIEDWDYGFKQNGFTTYRGTIDYQTKFQTSEIDFTIKKVQDKVSYFKPGRISVWFKPWWDKLIKKYYFNKALKSCDYFVFFWNTFNYTCEDLEILKRKNKKIVFILVGDEVRWQPAMQQDFESNYLPIIEYSNYDYSMNGLNNKLIYLRNAEKHGSVLMSQPNMSQLMLRPYYNLLIPILYHKFSELPIQNKIPVIVHAPTSVGKGSKYVEPVLNQLKDEGVQFEYVKIENMPRENALKIYEGSDIIIDQLLTPGGGKLAHEGLAMGKVVLTLMGHGKYDQKKPTECPLVDVDQNNLYDVLKELIVNVNKRQEIASKGRPYIEKYHNPKKIVKEVLDAIENPQHNKPDFYPTFFRDKFIPESEESINVYNKWTKYVSDCDWYKQYVKPGNRNGLVF